MKFEEMPFKPNKIKYSQLSNLDYWMRERDEESKQKRLASWKYLVPSVS